MHAQGKQIRMKFLNQKKSNWRKLASSDTGAMFKQWNLKSTFKNEKWKSI